MQIRNNSQVTNNTDITDENVTSQQTMHTNIS